MLKIGPRRDDTCAMLIRAWRRKDAETEGMGDTTGCGAASPTPNARRLLVLTGAEVSVDSGIPTFRAPGARRGDAGESDAGSPGAPVFLRDLVDRPGEVFALVRAITEASLEASPNPGHFAIAACQRRLRDRGGDLTLLTTNIDDLHERAGAETLHLYGRSWMDSCLGCDHVAHSGHRPGICANCGGTLRPDVVLVGEPTHAEASWHGHRALEDADAVYVVGTSGSTGFARSWVRKARQVGATTVLVAEDPEPDYAAEFDVVVRDRATNLADYLPV